MGVGGQSHGLVALEGELQVVKSVGPKKVLYDERAQGGGGRVGVDDEAVAQKRADDSLSLLTTRLKTRILGGLLQLGSESGVRS